MSRLLKDWIAGRGLPDTLVIDGHIHIGEWPHNTTFHSVDQAVAESVEYMDANGVDACCALSGGYMWTGTDYRLGNDFLLAVCQRLPDRMIGFLHINPTDTRDHIVAELDRMYGLGLRCIKLLNGYQNNYPGDGPNLMTLYEYAAKHRMLVFNHEWTPGVLAQISSQFPEIDFICGHYHASYDPVMRTRPNVYASTWAYGEMGQLDRGFANVGVGKFLLGSDGFLNPLSVGIGSVVFAPISDEDKRLILGLTQARLLDKVGVLPRALKERYGI